DSIRAERERLRAELDARTAEAEPLGLLTAELDAARAELNTRNAAAERIEDQRKADRIAIDQLRKDLHEARAVAGRTPHPQALEAMTHELEKANSERHRLREELQRHQAALA